MRGFSASQGSCDPVKVTLPELRIEGRILSTQTGELHLYLCAAICRCQCDLNERRFRSRPVGSSAVPSQQHAVRGIYFDKAASKFRTIEVEVKPLPHDRSCHKVPIIFTRPADIQGP